MKYRATHRHADVSPRKMRPFAALIVGRPADEALELLRFLPNRGARLIEAVLRSAIGNAQDRGSLAADELTVQEACIDGGPFLPRHQPRARGTAYPIKKRYAHIRIILTDGVDEPVAQTTASNA